MPTDRLPNALAAATGDDSPIETAEADARPWSPTGQHAEAPVAAEPARVTARPIVWEEDEDGTQWTEGAYGFAIDFDADEEPPEAYRAAWGEGDSMHFATLHEAQAWCQAEVDRWMAQHAVVHAAPLVTYLPARDELVINGRHYAASLFDERGLLGPPGTLLEVVQGPSDTVTVRTWNAVGASLEVRAWARRAHGVLEMVEHNRLVDAGLRRKAWSGVFIQTETTACLADAPADVKAG